MEKQILKKNTKLNNIKKDFFHKVSTEMVRVRRSRIVLEKLNVAGMRKNKHLSRSFQGSGISVFADILVNKANMSAMKVVYADKFYPSSFLDIGKLS